jgi:small redox-active disulfide protein 2
MHTIQVLGTGCRRCDALYASAQQAASVCGVDCEVQKVADIAKVLDFNVIALPALVIDGKVVSAGSVPSPDQIVRLIPST